MKKILLVGFLLNAIQVFAFEPNTIWTSKCEINGKSFSLNFKSPSGDPLNDDMAVSFKASNGTETMLILPPALYADRGVEPGLGNLCENSSSEFSINLAAFGAGENSVIFLISKNERPSPDSLILALINIENGKIDNIVSTNYSIYSNPNFKIRKSVNNLQVLVSEKGNSSAKEFWLNISIKSRAIVLKKI